MPNTLEVGLIRPSDLSIHYSELAHKTRVLTITLSLSVGAAGGAVWAKVAGASVDEARVLLVVGWLLILMPAALGILNFRYNRSFLNAIATAAQETHDADAARAWKEFKTRNEGPYTSRATDSRTHQLVTFFRRFTLNWLTYVLPVVAGTIKLYLAATSPTDSEINYHAHFLASAVVDVLLLYVWASLSRFPLRAFSRKRAPSPKTPSA